MIFVPQEKNYSLPDNRSHQKIVPGKTHYKRKTFCKIITESKVQHNCSARKQNRKRNNQNDCKKRFF